MSEDYDDTLDELLGLAFTSNLVLIGFGRCRSLDATQACLYASIIGGNLVETHPQLESWVTDGYIPLLLDGRKPEPIDNMQTATEVLLTTCVGDVMRALGRTPKTDHLDGLDLWDDEDMAMLNKVWSGI